MLKVGVVYPNNIPYLSSVIMVKKKDDNEGFVWITSL